ncbi:flavoprotein [Saccharopolyspora sp. CA-218241]|uniref:flavoprotein n=1 Tax=Saccharopolyspora sp. CA-218241 TaxID=3240027 RepID=UPI003D951C18
MSNFATPETRFLIGATGSIAVTRLPEYLGALRTAFGGSYTVLMTHTATNFLSPHAVGLSAERVIAREAPEDWPTDKPSRLAADHDIVLVLPATANVLSAAAAGAAPNRLTTVLLATERPVLFFPHMGTAMWRNPAVRRNVAQLREDGRIVVDPVEHADRDVVTGVVATHPALREPDGVVTAVRPALAAS